MQFSLVRGGEMGRILGFAGIMVAMAVALFFYSKQAQSVSGPAGNGGQSAINITGVKNDLIAIANSERAFFAQESRYAPLDELVSAKYLSIRTEGLFLHAALRDSNIVPGAVLDHVHHFVSLADYVVRRFGVMRIGG